MSAGRDDVHVDNDDNVIAARVPIAQTDDDDDDRRINQIDHIKSKELEVTAGGAVVALLVASSNAR